MAASETVIEITVTLLLGSKMINEDQEEVRDNKDIVIIGGSMVKYMTGGEMSRSSSVKTRSHRVQQPNILLIT